MTSMRDTMDVIVERVRERPDRAVLGVGITLVFVGLTAGLGPWVGITGVGVVLCYCAVEMQKKEQVNVDVSVRPPEASVRQPAAVAAGVPADQLPVG